MRLCGFTLVELMATLAVVAILVTVAAPAFTEVIQNNRRSGHTNELIRSLMVARTKAFATKIPVTMCKTTNGTACSTGAQWENGWLVFVDNNGDGTVDAADTDILERHGPLAAGSTLRGTTNLASQVTYRGDGTTTQHGTLTLCDSRGPSGARAVIISQTGRARWSDKDAQGNNLTCPSGG